MIKHCIIMASAYSLGKRIALDYCDKDILQMDAIQNDLEYIRQVCGEDVPISTHFIQTEREEWESIIKTDKFFENTKLVDNKDEFIKIIMQDRELKGIDIAKYILTKIPCTHLKLEKLVYMCYADYLCQRQEKLFNDKIYAYKLGPVIESVYNRYKKNGSDYIDREDDITTYDENQKELPIKSRILSSKDGIQKLLSIDQTLEKYGNFSASYLVDLTHKKYSPWTKSGAGTDLNQEILDDTIKKYHKYETL